MSTTRRELLALASGAAVGGGHGRCCHAGRGRRRRQGRLGRHLGGGAHHHPARRAHRPRATRPCGTWCTASIGGDELRIRLTNEFGETPLRDRRGAGRPAGPAAARAPTIVPGTDRRVTFGGRRRHHHPGRRAAGQRPGPAAPRRPAATWRSASTSPDAHPGDHARRVRVPGQRDRRRRRHRRARPSPRSPRSAQDLFLSGVAVRTRGSADRHPRRLDHQRRQHRRPTSTTAGPTCSPPGCARPASTAAWPTSASPATGCCTTRTRRPAATPRRSPTSSGSSALRRFDRDVLAQPGRQLPDRAARRERPRPPGHRRRRRPRWSRPTT